MKITDTIKYVGVNDHQIDLFEGQYKVPNGMSYNSYVILDEKIAVMDTVDANFTHEWLDNIQKVLGDRKPDYLIVQHMEPDHAANIANFLKAYPDTIVVSNKKAFAMMVVFPNHIRKFMKPTNDLVPRTEPRKSIGSFIQPSEHKMEFTGPFVENMVKNRFPDSCHYPQTPARHPQ